MTAELSAVVGFAVAAAVSCALTPLAIRLALRTGFLDRPRQYRKHEAPTPFLGGAAVLLAFSAAAVAVRGFQGRLFVILGGAAAMWVLGTLDDRFAVPPKWRLLATAGAAVALDRVGLGWSTSGGEVINVALTVFWIVGLVNAFNLMDNLDGACSSVACAAATGVGVLAAVKGEPTVAGLAFALSGACAGFLPWNLAGPAKIFLGDGGSMPIGFLVAALAMATARHSADGNAGLLAGALLVGLPILDVTLVSISRTRRGVSLMTGGRDHLTHRILLVLHTPRRVAAALAASQAALCGCAIVGYEVGSGAVVGIALTGFAVGIVAILLLDSASWRPAGIAMGSDQPLRGARPKAPSVGVDPG